MEQQAGAVVTEQMDQQASAVVTEQMEQQPFATEEVQRVGAVAMEQQVGADVWQAH